MLCPEYSQQAGGRPLHIFLRQNWARECVRDEFVQQQQQQQQRGSGREGCGLQEGATHRAAYHRVPPFYGEEHTTPQQRSSQLGIPSASPPDMSWLCLGGVAPSLARHARLPPPPPPQQQLDSSRTQQRIDPLLIWRLYIVHCSLFLCGDSQPLFVAASDSSAVVGSDQGQTLFELNTGPSPTGRLHSLSFDSTQVGGQSTVSVFVGARMSHRSVYMHRQGCLVPVATTCCSGTLRARRASTCWPGSRHVTIRVAVPASRCICAIAL
eukprot:COSAG01_NODE_7579_length_3140_cov_35.031240_1_plen_267_part_00